MVPAGKQPPTRAKVFLFWSLGGLVFALCMVFLAGPGLQFRLPPGLGFLSGLKAWLGERAFALLFSWALWSLFGLPFVGEVTRALRNLQIQAQSR